VIISVRTPMNWLAKRGLSIRNGFLKAIIN
jgi:hypothetical protein